MNFYNLITIYFAVKTKIIPHFQIADCLKLWKINWILQIGVTMCSKQKTIIPCKPSTMLQQIESLSEIMTLIKKCERVTVFQIY